MGYRESPVKPASPPPPPPPPPLPRPPRPPPPPPLLLPTPNPTRGESPKSSVSHPQDPSPVALYIPLRGYKPNIISLTTALRNRGGATLVSFYILLGLSLSRLTSRSGLPPSELTEQKIRDLC